MKKGSTVWKKIADLAETEASKISAKYGQLDGAPLSFQQLFETLGLRQRANAVNWLGTGGFIDLGETSPRIFYSSYDNRTRIRFTIAHELGHWVVFNNESLRMQIYECEAELSRSEEVFCDAFASALLMPRWEFSKNFISLINVKAVFIDHNYSIPNLPASQFVETLCSKFGVAFEACVHRIHYLELLKNSNVLIFCAKNRGKLSVPGGIKLRVSATACDRYRYFIPKNKGLYDLGWKGQAGSDIQEYFRSAQGIEKINIFYKQNEESKLRQKLAICEGDYFSYGKANRVLVGVYTVVDLSEKI